MSRLSYLQDHEVAIQSISEELNYLKRYLASGGEIDSLEKQELSKCLERLQGILGAYQEQESQAWQHNQEPLPPWLQPKQTKSNSEDEESALPGLAIV